MIFTLFDTQPTTPGLTVTFKTSLPANLIMTHSPEYPTLTPRFIRRYGYTRECGYYLRWTGYHAHPQLEPGDTTTHTYQLLAVDLPAPSWCAVAPNSHPNPKEPATPPLPLPSFAPPPIGGYARYQRTAEYVIPNGHTTAIPWDTLTLVIPPYTPSTPGPELFPPEPGTIAISSSGTMVGEGIGTITISLRRQSGPLIAQQIIPATPFPLEKTWSLTGTATADPLLGFFLEILNATTDTLRIGTLLVAPNSMQVGPYL